MEVIEIKFGKPKVQFRYWSTTLRQQSPSELLHDSKCPYYTDYYRNYCVDKYNETAIIKIPKV